MILKLFAFSVLLAMLVGLVWRFPVLWELVLVALLGGIYWIFFRIPPDSE